jgi:PAS domain S-box-containing protein
MDSEQRFEALLRVSPLGIGVTVGRVFHEVNARLCEMTGYAADELLGQSTRMLYPTDAAFAAAGQSAYPQLDDTGSARLQTRFRRKDGQVLDVALSMALLHPGEPARGVFATVLDVSAYCRTQLDLQAALDRLELALEGGELGIYEVDLITGEGWANDRYLSHVGLSQDHGIFQLGSWRSLLHPDDVETLKGAIADLYAGRADRAHVEYRLRHADGTWRWILDRSRVYSRDASGKALRVAGVHLDITERKAASAALEALNLERAVDRFVPLARR